MQFFLIKDINEIDNKVDYISSWLKQNWTFENGCKIEFKNYSNTRTIDQNSLMWKWLNEVSRWAIKQGWENQTNKKPEEVWKAYFVNEVFGLETIKMGKQEFDCSPTTSSLSKGEFQHLLEYIHNWAIERGVLLTIPRESEYYKNKDQ